MKSRLQRSKNSRCRSLGRVGVLSLLTRFSSPTSKENLHEFTTVLYSHYEIYLFAMKFCFNKEPFPRVWKRTEYRLPCTRGMFERHAAEQAELELAQARAAAAEAKAALAAARAAPESGTEQVAPGCQTESCFFKCFFK